MKPRLVLTDTPDPGEEHAAGAALYRHNIEQTGMDDRHPIAAIAMDPETGKVIGGLWARTELGLLFLSMFYLPETLRGSGVGSELLSMVEEARHRGCRHATVETSTFQAPGFYERHGYAEFGRVPFAVGDEARVFLRKDLGSGQAVQALQ